MKLADTSCVVCVFTELNCPFILMDWLKRGYKITITNQVHKELTENERTKSSVIPEIQSGKICVNGEISENEVIAFRTRYPKLGLGECSVILTALKLNQEKKKYYAILDDKDARKTALKLGITMTGTYGMLKALREKNMIDEQTYNTCKDKMEKSKFRINFDKIK